MIKIAAAPRLRRERILDSEGHSDFADLLFSTMEKMIAASLFYQRGPHLPKLEGPYHQVMDHNIVHRLMLRSISLPSPSQVYHRERSFYQSVVPNYTEPHVQVPSGYLRKFSPDGNFLLGFSSDQKSVVIYSYLGAGAGRDLYRGDSKQEPDKIRLDIF